MKDIEPLAGNENQNTKGALQYWAIISNELDDLGLTKAEFRIFCHICRRAGPPRFVCNAGNRSIARITRTHPDYVRWVVRHLVQRRLLVRVPRPGRTTELHPADKFAWLNKHGTDADKVNTAYEETAGESVYNILWSRLWTVMPGAKKARYEKRMKENPILFESVLAEVEDRVKRGKTASADSLSPIRDAVGLFEYTWSSFSKAKGNHPKK